MRAAQRAEALLELMLQDAPPEWGPTQFWKEHIPAILEDIALYGIDHFGAHPSAQHLYAGITDLKKAAKDYNKLPAPPNYSQSSIGCLGSLFEVDKRQYSGTALNYLRGLAFFNRPTPRVLEIGGGYGVLGDILLQSKATALYVNVDIPPLAAVATYYLEQLWGDAVLDYGQTRHLPTIDLARLGRDYRAIILCPWQLPRVVGSIDVGVNFISFQEMEPKTVATYAAHLTRLGASHLLLRNSRNGKPGTASPVTRETILHSFSHFNLLDADHEQFGDAHPSLISEVLIMKRKA